MCSTDSHKTPRRAGSRGRTRDGQRLHFSKKGGPRVEGLLQPSDTQFRVSEYYGALLIDT
jgi:hypothetical protein